MNVLVNYGALGACLAYFVYKDNKTMQELKSTVFQLKEVVTLLNERLVK